MLGAALQATLHHAVMFVRLSVREVLSLKHTVKVPLQPGQL